VRGVLWGERDLVWIFLLSDGEGRMGSFCISWENYHYLKSCIADGIINCAC